MNYKVPVLMLLLAGISSGVDVENSLSEKFDLGGYIDAGFTQWGFYNAVPSREFSIRRAGIELGASVTQTVEADIQIELQTDAVFLKDAFLTFLPCSRLEMRFGQFKRQTLLGGMLSSWKLPMFDRPLLYDFCENLTYAGRDIGVDVELDLPAVKGIELSGIAGFFNGDERGEERTDSEFLYSFRGQMEVPSFGLTLGGSAVSHRLGQETSSVPEGYSVSARQNSFSADVSVDYEVSNWYEFSLSAEAATGDNWSLADVVAGNTAPSFLGFWGALTGFYHPWNVRGIKTVSLSVCYDQLTHNTDLDTRETTVSLIGSVYPTDNIRFRFGGEKHNIDGILSDSFYTDYIFEAGLNF